jgi:hypothetical protein
MADEPMDGRSIEERAADQDGQMEAFPMGAVDGDAKVSLRSLVKVGESVEFTAAMRSAEVPLRGGLIDPRKGGRLLVSYEGAKVEVVPKREDGQVAGWKVRQSLRPTFVEPVGQTDADLIEHYFRELIAASPSEGGALADRIAAVAAEQLAAA